MDFYISDLHFGHAAVLELCKRPFKDISEMNEALVANWNASVGARDTVYVVGDLFYRSETDPEDILRRLKGKKYLILGNHDKDWTGRVDLSKYFEDVRDIITVNCGRGNATLCHFPMLFFEGKYHIYGHVHARENFPHKDTLYSMENAFNAGADVNNFRPVTFDELIRNNLAFRVRVSR